MIICYFISNYIAEGHLLKSFSPKYLQFSLKQNSSKTNEDIFLLSYERFSLKFSLRDCFLQKNYESHWKITFSKWLNKILLLRLPLVLGL